MGHPWADESLSGQLPELRAAGESDRLEFKAQLPKNIRKIAEEVAAFASSGGGTILLGVADNGELVGLVGYEEASERDQLVERLRGSFQNSIKPAVKTRMVWAVEKSKLVLVVQVEHQAAPVYYYEQRPYLRDHAASRAAAPEEVVALILNFHARSENDPTYEVRTSIAAILTATMAWMELDSETRYLNPILEEWLDDCRHSSGHLRELVIENPGLDEPAKRHAQALAEALEGLADTELDLGYGEELDSRSEPVRAAATALHQTLIEPTSPSDDELEKVRAEIEIEARKLVALAVRAEHRIFREEEAIRGEAGEKGKNLVRLSFYKLNGLGADFSERLRRLGLQLWDLKTRQLYADGGVGLERVVKDLADASRELLELTERTPAIAAGARDRA